MARSQDKETYEDFKNSFFYGSRSDMSFKFLEHLSEKDSSSFLCGLFRDTIDALDNNDLSLLKKRMVKGQGLAYDPQKNFAYDKGPFHKPDTPLSQLKLCLLTSSGHFLKSQPPNYLGMENMTQKQAEQRISDFLKEEPVLSEIPFNTPMDRLTAVHGGYDTRAALKDPNVAFPLNILNSLKEKGTIRDLTPFAYSFVGACSQKRLLKKTLPRWIDRLSSQGRPDAVLLVPV